MFISRELHSRFESLAELEKVKGVPKHFFKRFCDRNQIVL